MNIEVRVNDLTDLISQSDAAFAAMVRVAKLHSRQRRPKIEKCSCGSDPCPTLAVVEVWLVENRGFRNALSQRFLAGMVSEPGGLVEYQWGVVYDGRELGWISYETKDEARAEAFHVDDRYAPAHLARRALGPIEII